MSGVKCKYHCSPCGRHFHSLEAFELHINRDKDYEGELEDAPRIGCHSPGHSREVLGELVGFEGLCDISGAEVLEGTVWEKTSRRGNVRTAKA
jgi:hypothetical protein